MTLMILFGSFFGLLVFGVPVAFSLGLVMALLLTTYIPAISMTLPRLFGL